MLMPLLAMMIQTADEAPRGIAGPDIRYAARPAPRRTETPVRCDPRARGGSDIVVCARPTDQRLPKLDDARFAERSFVPTFRAAGAQALVAAGQRSLPDGKSAPALMLTFTWPFGAKKKKADTPQPEPSPEP